MDTIYLDFYETVFLDGRIREYALHGKLNDPNFREDDLAITSGEDTLIGCSWTLITNLTRVAAETLYSLALMQYETSRSFIGVKFVVRAIEGRYPAGDCASGCRHIFHSRRPALNKVRRLNKLLQDSFLLSRARRSAKDIVDGRVEISCSF